MGNDQWWLIGARAWVAPGTVSVNMPIWLGVAGEFADKRYICQKLCWLFATAAEIETYAVTKKNPNSKSTKPTHQEKLDERGARTTRHVHMPVI